MELEKMSPLSQARYFKKNRRSIDEDTLNQFLNNSTNFPHIPSKNESHLLRRLMSQTGLTESQIREIPSYRKALSDSQHKDPKFYFSRKNSTQRYLKRILKNITRTTGLTIEHPTSLALAREKLKELKDNYYFNIFKYLTFDLNDISDKSIIAIYHEHAK